MSIFNSGIRAADPYVSVICISTHFQTTKSLCYPSETLPSETIWVLLGWNGVTGSSTNQRFWLHISVLRCSTEDNRTKQFSSVFRQQHYHDSLKQETIVPVLENPVDLQKQEKTVAWILSLYAASCMLKISQLWQTRTLPSLW